MKGIKKLNGGEYTYNMGHKLPGDSKCFRGELFIGKHATSTDPIAIKVLNKMKANAYASKLNKTVENEASSQRALCELDDPYILKFFNNLETASSYYIITEYCNKGSLKSIQSQQKFTEEEVLDILYQCIIALLHLSLKSILHKDFKIENIQNNNGVYKLAGFGWSIFLNKTKDTYISDFRCKPPEFQECGSNQQLEKHMTNKVDIWGLGMVGYELLFGEHYIDQNLKETKVKEQLDQISGVIAQKKINPGIKEFLMGCLAIDPMDRYSLDQLKNLECFALCKEKFIKKLHPILQRRFYLEDQSTTQSGKNTIQNNPKVPKDTNNNLDVKVHSNGRNSIISTETSTGGFDKTNKLLEADVWNSRKVTQRQSNIIDNRQSFTDSVQMKKTSTQFTTGVNKPIKKCIDPRMKPGENFMKPVTISYAKDTETSQSNENRSTDINPSIRICEQIPETVHSGLKIKNGEYCYDIKHKLGGGVYGKFYKGVHIPSNSTVVIKEIPLEKIKKSSPKEFAIIKQNMNAYEIFLKIKNPYLVNIIDIFEWKLNYYIVSEFYNEGTLEQKIEKNDYKPFGDLTSFEIVCQIMLALKILSEKDIVIREFDAGNIFVKDGLHKFNYTGFTLGSSVTKPPSARAQFDLGGNHNFKGLSGSPNMETKPKQVNTWSIGCLAYQLLLGKSIYCKSDQYTLPANLDENIRQFMNKCLSAVNVKPTIDELINHKALMFCLNKYVELMNLYLDESETKYKFVNKDAMPLMTHTTTTEHQIPMRSIGGLANDYNSEKIIASKKQDLFLKLQSGSLSMSGKDSTSNTQASKGSKLKNNKLTLKLKTPSPQQSLSCNSEDTPRFEGSMVFIANDKYSYDMRKKLGGGAYGDVYKGMNVSTKEIIAIKVILVSKLERIGDKAKETLKSEIETLIISRDFNNPFLMQIIDYIEDKENYYIITEFCEGGTLEDDIYKRVKKTKDPYSIRESLEILYQIILGLSGLQDGKIAHRDQKPDNIFINKGILKLGDFGFAKQSNQKFSTVCGTPLFMAPELYGDTHDKTGLVDIWALGCIGHYQIYGELPFDGDTVQDIKLKVQNHEYAIPAKNETPCMRAMLDKKVADFLAGCLKKNPNERYTVEQCRNHAVSFF